MAQQQGATIIFVDESGFSLIPPVRCTWAPRGRTPLLRHANGWPKLSAISGVTRGGRLLLMLERGAIGKDRVVEFLGQMLRQIAGPLILIWDNLPAHKSGLVQQWLAAHPRIHEERLPAYAPELNADEGFWQWIKSEILGNFCPEDLEQLEREIHKGARRARRRPELIDSFMKRTGLEV